MCTYVNVKYKDVDFAEDDWYMKHEWNSDQEKAFGEWLSNEIRTNKEVRKHLTNTRTKPSKSWTEKYVMQFNMMYGWKTKEN
jgi:hypothetical protein